MDKKSIVNDSYQAVIISVFAIGYSILGKKIPKICSSEHPDIPSERHGKAGCYRCCIRDDERVSDQTEDSTKTY